MKKVVSVVLTALLAIGHGSNATAGYPGDDSKKCAMMKGGKMVWKEAGKTKPMDSDMTMNDGTVIKSNGMVVKNDGTSRMLADGEKVCMDKNGKMMDDRDMMKDKDRNDKDNNKNRNNTGDNDADRMNRK